MHNVTQRDREAAWPQRHECYSKTDKQAWMGGHYDDIPLVQAFARHRTADTARIAALEEALRNLRDRYIRMIDSGDCGSWNPREEDVVIAATTALGGQP